MYGIPDEKAERSLNKAKVNAFANQTEGEAEPAAEDIRRSRGRRSKPQRKINQTLRLDPDVLEAFRREGSGWQARINEILRRNMPGRGK